MSVEVTLFLLRLLSGGLLLAILALLLLLLWRDYRGAVRQVEASRRSFGRIVVVADDDEPDVTEQVYPLLPLTSFGRAPTNTIVVSDDFASSEHALVALRNGQWWLEDRGSRNGTMLNEVRISQPVIVTDGDTIGIGTARFRLELAT
jgi:hypothetical protein